ncbi:hypothetical protein BC940DRAFT_38795 [Gongronella butleri]|nr:hypothetical protein BC940DRAFT_38795 [Gongronella butleri]
MSSCPKCLCGYICIVKEVKRGPQNLARWFWTCPLSACAYFRWDTPNDQFHKLPTSKIQSVLDPSAPRGTTTPLCHCKIPCRMFTMKKPGKDYGRNYYKCQQMRCGFYQLGESGTNVVPKIGVARSSSMMDPSMPDFSVANTTSASRVNRVPLTTALTSAQRTDASKYRQKRASKRPVVSMVLHSAYDVSIQLSHPEKRGYLHSIVKVIDGVCWREELNHWVFPADQASCDRVSETLSKYQVNFQVEDLPVGIYHMLPPTRLELLKNIAASQREPRADEDLSWLGSRYEQDRIVSSPMWQQLTPVQKFGIYYCTTKLDGRVYLCDELGTGKSLQALGILLTKSLSGRTLIVCNPSMCLSWKRFIEDSLDVDSEDIAMIRIKLPKQKLAKVPATGTQQQSKLLQKRERQQKQQNRKRARPDPSISHATTTLSSRLDRTFTDEDFGSGQVYLAIKVDTNDPFVLDYNRYYGPEVIFDDQEHAIPTAASSSAADDEPLYNVITTLPQLERSQARFFIIDYDRLWRSPALTNKKWFDDYIFDDSNMVARQTMDKTAWRKRIQKTISRSHCTIMINDDDLYRRPIHSFAALRLLHPDVFISSKFYGERYCMAERSVFGVNYTVLQKRLIQLETRVSFLGRVLHASRRVLSASDARTFSLFCSYSFSSFFFFCLCV